jgi:hypothetical protein
MVRKQVYLTAEQDAWLKKRASHENRSEADIIRDALQTHRRAPRRAERPTFARDPLWGIVGLGASSAGDGSTQVDHYLYGAPRKRT